MRDILRSGCGVKMSYRDRDAFISVGWKRDSSEIVGKMQDLKSLF